MSKKTALTERWVDEHIATFSYPPTYQKVADHFGIAKSAAYARCRGFRKKMKHGKKLVGRDFVLVNMGFSIPKHLYAQFREKITVLDEFLVTPKQEGGEDAV